MNTAVAMDASDPLARFTQQFSRPPGIYLDGNSLGLMCRAADASLQDAIGAWRSLAIRGWTEGKVPWFGMSRRVSERLAPLLGCEPADVMVGGSTTLNLHQLLTTFGGRSGRGIAIDGTHFPTDRYAVESYLRLRHPQQTERIHPVAPRADRLLDEADLIDALPGMSAAVFPAVVYTTGQLIDMQRVTEFARKSEIPVMWDCSHSAGVIPHRFRDEGIELAFGCGYKYLNGGPGASGWLYVHPRLRDQLPGLAGWFGCDPARQFEMGAQFHPAHDADRFQLGTPHILSLAPLLGSLQVINEAGMEPIRHKSLAQTDFLLHYAGKRLNHFGVVAVSPLDPIRRGGHVTLAHVEAAKLSRALRQRGIIVDFRPPDMVRLAPAPLYTSFRECEVAIDTLELILSSREYQQLTDTDELVT